MVSSVMLSNVLTTVQNGVVAINEFGKQLNGSLLSIQSQIKNAATPSQGVTTIAVSSQSIVLSSAQFQTNNITFNSTLSASITVTFPTSFTNGYTIRNLCTGSSAFTITLQTASSGSQVICAVPGNPFECFNDGTNLYFVNFGGPIGSYWDYAGSSVPNWVSGCTIPPYLNCTGGTYSSSIYMLLFSILGSSILPDMRSRVRVALDQGAGVNSSAATGLSSVGTTGGAQTTTLSSQHLPKLTDPGHVHSIPLTNSGAGGSNLSLIPGAASNAGSIGTQNSNSNTTGIAYGSSTQIGVPIVQPTVVAGLTLIRAA